MVYVQGLKVLFSSIINTWLTSKVKDWSEFLSSRLCGRCPSPAKITHIFLGHFLSLFFLPRDVIRRENISRALSLALSINWRDRDIFPKREGEERGKERI